MGHHQLQYLAWLCSLFLVAGCAKAGPGPVPEEVARLAPVLAELQLLEGVVMDLPLDLRDSMRQEWSERILQDHNMTPDRFDSLSWVLRSQSEWTARVYEDVMRNIGELAGDNE